MVLQGFLLVWQFYRFWGIFFPFPAPVAGVPDKGVSPPANPGMFFFRSGRGICPGKKEEAEKVLKTAGARKM